MTHTPGPWEIQTPFEPDSYSIVQAGLKSYEWQFIAQVPVGIPAEGMFPRQEARANARLIAAAPELLEALKVLVSEEWSEMDDDDLAYEASQGNKMVISYISARAAIAKAEGRT